MTSTLKRSVNLCAMTVASGLMMATSASAADFAPPPPLQPVISWSGLYIGTHIGAGEADFDGIVNHLDEGGIIDVSSAILGEDLGMTGVLGGVQAGFNFDIGSFVLGVEGDVSFMDWEGLARANDSSEEATAEIDLLASVRGRIGLPMGAERRVMPYLTAGVAWADAEATVFWEGRAAPDPEFPNTNVDFDGLGGVVGAGTEWAVTDQFRVRIESLYYFFNDKKTVVDAESFIEEPGDLSGNLELEDIWTVRVGANWYFTTPGF